MSVQQGHQTQSTMTTKEMAKSFLPIILFSIILPLIDIGTDLRIIIRLYYGTLSCIPEDDVSYDEWLNCRTTDDLSTFCQQDENRHLCKLEEHPKFATLLLGEFICYLNMLL